MKTRMTKMAAIVIRVSVMLGVFACAVESIGAQVGNDPSTASDESIVDSALGSTPWFDADAKSLVPVTVSERIDDSVNRKSRWLPKPEKLAKPPPTNNTNVNTGGTGGSGTGGSGFFGSGWTMANLFGWMLLALLIVVAVGLVVYAFSKAEIDLGKAKDVKKIHSHTPDQQMVERMKHLPAELRRTDVNLRTEAERLMKEERFDQAIILLFGHQLLMLDHAGALRLTRGKTNGRYVRETRSDDRESGDRLSRTVAAFERSYFGKHKIAQSEFQSLWENNQAMELRLSARHGAAA